jgi:hypothetical protein
MALNHIADTLSQLFTRDHSDTAAQRLSVNPADLPPTPDPSRPEPQPATAADGSDSRPSTAGQAPALPQPNSPLGISAQTAWPDPPSSSSFENPRESASGAFV